MYNPTILSGYLKWYSPLSDVVVGFRVVLVVVGLPVVDGVDPVDVDPVDVDPVDVDPVDVDPVVDAFVVKVVSVDVAMCNYDLC